MSDGSTKNGYDVEESEKEKAWIPKNSGEGYSGSYSLEGALTNSINVVSANLIHRVGVTAVRTLAKDMGVTNELQNDMSIALGSADISLFDMIKVYGTFATRGRRPEPTVVLKVTTRDGKVIADFGKDIHPEKWQQVLTTDQADMMTKMMKSVVDEGTAGRLRYNYDLNNDIAGKTGTTQSQADGWFMCFTPNLVCGAWVGGITPAVRFREMSLGQGAYTALPLSGLFLQKLYKTPQYSALKNEKFAPLSKAIIDSMECAHKSFTDDERSEMAAENTQDSLNTLIQKGTLLPMEKPTMETDDNYDLRNGDGKKDGKNDGLKPLQSATLPTAKPEIKSQPTPLLNKNQPPPPPKLPKGK